MRIFLFSFLTFLLFTLTGCGGEGGDGTSVATTNSRATPISNSANIKTDSLSRSITPTSDNSIKVVDSSAVTGLTILCDGTKLTTDARGGFQCDSLPFSIFLGEYKLGEIDKLPADRVIHTQDIMQVPRGAIDYPEVTKASMILQTLDNDANPLNGITLKNDVIEILNAQLSQKDKLKDFSIEHVNNMLQDVIATRKKKNTNSKLQLISSKEAQINLTTMTAKTPARTYAQRSQGKTK